jgi:predicted adenine nucleotide alpha hydrolase (AANH) superfamily ATPase
MKPQLLLHICCGICASRIVESLQANYEIIGFFYNPNIEPKEEYENRLNVVRILTLYYKIPLIIGQYENHLWHEAVKGYEHYPEGSERCTICFRMRLEKTARLCLEKSLENFATTLTANPHKDSLLVNNLGYDIAQGNNINFLPIILEQKLVYDLTVAKKLNLYRQKYCGCRYSKC